MSWSLAALACSHLIGAFLGAGEITRNPGPNLPFCPKYTRDASFAYTSGDEPEKAVNEANPDASRGVQATSALLLIDNKKPDEMKRRFSVMIGGNDIDDSNMHSNDLGKGTLENFGGDWVEPTWFAEAGFVLARGWRPRIRTSIVVVVSDSTRYIVRIVSRVYLQDVLVGGEDQIILLEGGPITISTADELKSETLINPDTYVSASFGPDGYSISEARPLPERPDNDVINHQPRKFVDRVLSLPLASMPQ